MGAKRFYFDTSALSPVLNDSDKLRALQSVLLRRRITCYVPQPAIYEMVAGGNEEHNASRLMALGELSASLPPWQLRLAAGYREAIRAELSAPQSRVVEESRHFLDRLARCWTESRWDLVREDARELSGTIADHIRDRKQWFFETDRQLASLMGDKLGGTLDVPSACDYIQVGRAPTKDEMWVGAAAKLSNGLWSEQAIIDQPERFRVVHTLAQLTFRQCVANAVEAALFERASFEEKKLIGAFRVKAAGGKGDWYDAIIVGSAVYADAFVARDRGILRRCQYMRELGFVRFDVISIDDIV